VVGVCCCGGVGVGGGGVLCGVHFLSRKQKDQGLLVRGVETRSQRFISETADTSSVVLSRRECGRTN